MFKTAKNKNILYANSLAKINSLGEIEDKSNFFKEADCFILW